MHPWNASWLVEIVREALAAAARGHDREQAVTSLDGLDEAALQGLVSEAFRAAGIGVWPECRYPSARDEHRRNRGARCDLVLTVNDAPPGSLAGEACADKPAEPWQIKEALAADDCFWMEIKAVAQFRSTGPARDYGARLLGDVAADIGRLGSDPALRYAGLLLILFTGDRDIARHDLLAWRLRCLERDLPVFSPAVADFALNDRLGNGHLTLALFPVGRGGSAGRDAPGGRLTGPRDAQHRTPTTGSGA